MTEESKTDKATYARWASLRSNTKTKLDELQGSTFAVLDAQTAGEAPFAHQIDLSDRAYVIVRGDQAHLNVRPLILATSPKPSASVRPYLTFPLHAVTPFELLRAVTVLAHVNAWISGELEEFPKEYNHHVSFLGNAGAFARVAFLAAQASTPFTQLGWDDLSEREQRGFLFAAEQTLDSGAKTPAEAHDAWRKGALEVIYKADEAAAALDPFMMPLSDLPSDKRVARSVFYATVIALDSGARPAHVETAATDNARMFFNERQGGKWHYTPDAEKLPCPCGMDVKDGQTIKVADATDDSWMWVPPDGVCAMARVALEKTK